MKKTLTLLVFALSITISCNKILPEITPANADTLPVLREKSNPVPVPEGDALSKVDLDKLVIETMERQHDFRWEMVDLKALWSATLYGDQSVAIGYKPTGFDNIESIIHKIDLKTDPWKSVHDALIQLVMDELETQGRATTLENLIVEDDQVLPIITFKLTDKNVLTKLYNLENVRYVEPLDYWPGTDADRSTSGCSVSTTGLNSNDYSTTTPNCLLPWNFNNTNIPSAWSSASGLGITIGIIDAGLSSSQSLLGSNFNNGDSNVGRTVTTDYTWGSSAYASCSHGTSMSGTAVGPRNNQGATTGVSYKSNLHFIRGCEDVVLDKSSERTGVKNALVKMGNKPEVKIVSMSVGTPFYSSVLYDGVVYAHNQGKMLMAAAGTSFSFLSWWGVVYPAVHTQCVAVTGVNENYNTCSSCHDGSEVDFTIVMERSGNSNRNSLSLKPSGTAASYIGGSSVATATAAGVAGLVWSLNPNFTREQVFDFLKTTSQYYPGISNYAGYGTLNAGAAVAAAQAAI
ncbi:MAG: S8 family serine peptidase [Flavobacteriales bacterium]